jgi:hypothetical protein
MNGDDGEEWMGMLLYIVADHITHDEVNGVLLHGLVQQRKGLLLGQLVSEVHRAYRKVAAAR